MNAELIAKTTLKNDLMQAALAATAQARTIGAGADWTTALHLSAHYSLASRRALAASDKHLAAMPGAKLN